MSGDGKYRRRRGAHGEPRGDFGQRAEAGGHGRVYMAGRDIRFQLFGRKDRPLAARADDLATAVHGLWEKESLRRMLGDPAPLSVRWEAVDPGLVQDWHGLVALARTGAGWPVPPAEGSWAGGPGELAGEGRLTDVLARIPTGRLVVLGERGAGKTILLVRLVLDLIARRTPGAPVPVLFSLSSWDPVHQDLRTWLEQRLTVDFTGLNRKVPGRLHGRRTVARALLDEGFVLTLLDGFDELPAGVRGLAVRRINDALLAGQGLVLASRSAEFRAAVRPPDGANGFQVAGAAGVELRPLHFAQVAAHLRSTAGGPAGAARWDEVLAAIRADPARPVARTLNTPLMIGMARVIYNPRPGEALSALPRRPAELLRGNLRTPRDVRELLLDGFVPAAYRLEPRKGDQALGWLTFLADDLGKRLDGITDLGWWRLAGAAPRLLSGLLVGTVSAALGAYGLRIPASAGIGLMAAVGGGLLGRRLFGSGSGMAAALGGGLLGGVLGTLLAMVLFGAEQGVGPSLTGALAACITVGSMGGFRAGLVGGFAGGFAAVLTGRPEVVTAAPLINGVGLGLGAGCAATLARHVRPASGFHWSWTGLVTGLVAGLTMGLAAGLQAGPARGLLLGVVTTVLGSLAGGLEGAPADTTAVADPAVSLAGDRRTFWATGIVGGLAVGVSTGLGPRFPPGSGDDLAFGLRVGLANAVAVGLAFGFLRAAYGRFTVARWWLALRARLPWHLMRFLDDAHTHGVLRQTGASYEFAHGELQQRLASPPPPAPGVPFGTDVPGQQARRRGSPPGGPVKPPSE
ncbi:NACHT domain-containing protein [Streptomyces sp. NPDC004111]|uniref:NACHT domain-containing protein n=1 Tax=Streptomyces sp. NPDC004111 TaxID=3364690 RepID=UPI003683FF12